MLKVSALSVDIGTKIVFLLLHLNNRSSKTFKIVYHTNPFTFESPHTSQNKTYDVYLRVENMFTEHCGVEIGGGGFG